MKQSYIKDIGQILAPLEEPTSKFPSTLLIDGALGIRKSSTNIAKGNII